jgi:ribosomal protein S18 acetylase RimI-like enzyme
MIALRPVSTADETFLYQVYASTRAQEMMLVNWPAVQQAAFLHMQFNAQRQSYQMQFPEATHQVILRNTLTVGRLIVNRTAEESLLVDIALLPAYRNAGIGTQLIQDLQTESMHLGKVVRLHVETFNPALRLYQRLGFTQIGEHGSYLAMEWRPPHGENTQA